MADIPIYILDAFALMAYLKGETSAQRVRDLLHSAERGKCKLHISIINLGEVLYNVERNNGLNKAHEALTLIQSLPIEILPAENQTVFAAAHIKANYPVLRRRAHQGELSRLLRGCVRHCLGATSARRGRNRRPGVFRRDGTRQS